jgi:hypothetical protein
MPGRRRILAHLQKEHARRRDFALHSTGLRDTVLVSPAESVNTDLMMIEHVNGVTGR